MIHEPSNFKDYRLLFPIKEDRGVLIRICENTTFVRLYIKTTLPLHIQGSFRCIKIQSTLNEILENIAYYKMIANDIIYYIYDGNNWNTCSEKNLLERLVEY